jgi:pimeloyl-ACP methyl ester carboxylesterase
MSAKDDDVRAGRVTSLDGTVIAYEERGNGPTLILVDGAFCSRAFGPMGKLAASLAHRFRVITYDRRGRNESADTLPYAIEREIEDLSALIEIAGDSAFLYGASSGAVLALRAAASHAGVKRLAMYEPPIVIAGSPEPVPPDRVRDIVAMAKEGRRAEATKTFMRMVGTPGFAVLIMRFIPGVWSKLLAAAHTLPYDFAALGDTGANKPLPEELVRVMASVKVPALVGVGGKSPAWMKHTARVVASGIPGAALRSIEGQTHVISEKALAPVLVEFFQGGEAVHFESAATTGA